MMVPLTAVFTSCMRYQFRLLYPQYFLIVIVPLNFVHSTVRFLIEAVARAVIAVYVFHEKSWITDFGFFFVVL